MATQEKPKNSEKAVPLDSSSSSRNRQSLDDLQKRRDQLSQEDEMVRRNKRSLLLRMKNRLRATKR